jgi:hypothetical protein
MIETYSPLSPRVKTYQTVSQTIPEFAISENPFFTKFLEQYYISQDFRGGPADIIENLDAYISLDNLTKDVIRGTTSLNASISASDDTIVVDDTDGFPAKYGLLKINDEIITYTEKTQTSFVGCSRGFSGISSYRKRNDLSNLIYEDTTAASHESGANVNNLSSLFLKEFYRKLKGIYAPGLEGVTLSPDLNVGNFIKEARSLYESKGTRASFVILFKALFGLEPKINDLEKYLIKPSFANYVRRKSISVELLSGDIFGLVGETLFQDNDPNDDKINAASGPISEVTQIRDNFYKISLFTGFDERSLTDGTFVIAGRTRNIGIIGLGASVLTVDSTVGFSTEGVLEIGTPTDSYYQQLNYTTKSVNQFYDVDTTTVEIPDNITITAPTVVYGYESSDLTKKVEMRVTGVISKFKSNQPLRNLDYGSAIRVRNLGRYFDSDNGTYETVFFNSWIYNTSTRFLIESFAGSNFTIGGYIEPSSLMIGDTVDIVRRGASTIVAVDLKVTNINRVTNSITVSGNVGTLDTTFDHDIIRRQKKATSTIVPILGGDEQLLADINNTYISDESVSSSKKREGFVASSSLPSYTINIDKVHAKLTNPTLALGNWQGFDSIKNGYAIISFDNAVPFQTGDEISYVPAPGTPAIGGIDQSKTFFVEVQGSNNKIKLYQSRSFIKANLPVYFSPPLSGNTGEHDFVFASQARRSIFPSRPVRRFVLEQNLTSGKELQTTSERTADGNTGMLVNGTEILNYKSADTVFFGPIERVNILNSGTDYDAQNPPNIVITDENVSVANTAGAVSVVSGSVKSIFIDPTDFDIDKVTGIEIFGGNGSGAIARAFLEERFREVFFSGVSTNLSGNTRSFDNTIAFNNDHNFSDGEKIIYDNNGAGNLGIGTTGPANQELSLFNGQVYFANVKSPRVVSLHNNKTDAILGLSTITFDENALLANSGVHIFRTSEQRTTIGKLIVEDPGSGYSNRHLAVKPAGINTANNWVYFKRHGWKNGDIINYTYDTTPVSGIDSSKQYKVLRLDENRFRLAEAGNKGDKVGIFTDFFNHDNIILETNGSGFQRFFSPEIKCNVNILTKDSQEKTLVATPIVRGEIEDILLYEEGRNYGSDIVSFDNSPNVSIPFGVLGQIGLVIANGKIADAFVQNGGSGYTGPPDLEVVSVGATATGAILRSIVSNGKITDVKIISSGVGYADTTTSISVLPVGTNFKCEAAIRPILVSSAFDLDQDEMAVLYPNNEGLAVNYVGYGKSFREFMNDDGSGHSPIVGWAYDGNPIYGPYGLNNPADVQSDVKRMISGYEIVATNIPNRPASSLFPFGYFVDDFVYTGNGDLDEHNGRFTKTPEFPQGVYAYFATVDILNKPVFPFFIGDTYRSFAVPENTLLGKMQNQVEFNFEGSELTRNTTPYNLFGDGVAYDYVFQPYKKVNQISNPDNLIVSSIDGFVIDSPGEGYSIGENLIFNNVGTSGTGADAEVSRILGQQVNKVESDKRKLSSCPIVFDGNGVTFQNFPFHDFQANDVIEVTGVSTFVRNLEGYKKIAVTDYKTVAITTTFTGIVTDIHVRFIPPNVSVGDSVGIGTEIARLLETFPSEKIGPYIRLERPVGVTTTTEFVGSAITYYQNKFTVPVETDPFNSKFQETFYFNPRESVGVGTTAGLSTSVLVTVGPNTGTASLMSQNLYLNNHPLVNNQKVTLKNNGNTAIQATRSVDPWIAPSGISGDFFVTRLTNSSIGLKTTTNSDELFFVTNGDDVYTYSIETNYAQETADATRSTITITTENDHKLSENDELNLTVRPGFATGIGASTMVDIRLLDGFVVVNPVEIPTSGVNTTTNVFTVADHNLQTGFKVLMYGAGGVPSQVPGGLSQRPYFVLKIDNNNFQLTNSYTQLFKNPPEVVGFTSTGFTGQTVNPVNPPINVTKQNDIVFNLSDSSLLGSDLKIFYDANNFNEYIGTGNTTNLQVIGVGTVGIATTNPADTPRKTITFDSEVTETLFYTIEKGGYIVSSDNDVLSNNQILYFNSGFTGNYTVTGVGSTTITANIAVTPEKLSYLRDDCDDIFYTTTSIGATGGVAKIRLQSGGINYSKLPGVSGVGTIGISAVITPTGDNINLLDSVVVPTDVYGYPSDITLRPDAFLPRIVQAKNANKLIDAKVVFGGRQYLNAPSLVVYDKSTGEIIDNGLITCELSDSAVNSVSVIVNPRGLTGNDYGLAPLQNSNGVGVIEAFSDVGVLTCKIQTPVLGYVIEPFNTGDIVFLEGVTFNNDGDGFNSGDYKFQNFSVADYNSATNPRQVTFNYIGISSNVGTGATCIPGFGQIVKAENLAQFSVTKAFSEFKLNEPLRRNNDLSTNLVLDSIDTKTGILVISGSFNLEIDDKITGTNSGDSAEVQDVIEFDGYFNIDSTINADLGWSDNVGKINDGNQFLPDNDYYQNMSYAIESSKTYEELVNYVNDIVHPAGFKNFANTQILSVGNAGESLEPADDAGGLVLDFVSDPLRVDSIYNFDRSRDVDATATVSKFLQLESNRLSDFILCKTNRVLLHDDISPEFVSNESNDLSDERTVASVIAGRNFSRYLIQTVHKANDPQKNQYQLNEAILITINKNTYFLQKSHMVNTNQVGLSTGLAQFFSVFDTLSNQTQLRIKPYEPYDTDYDIKVMQQGFAADIGSGIGTLGVVENVSSNKIVSTGTTTNIVGIGTTTGFVAGLAHFVIIDKGTNEADYVELALQYDGSDTYTTELASFNTRQSLGGLSAGKFMGTFTSYIENDVYKVDYIHDEVNNLDVRSKIITFNNVGLGTTSVKHFNIPFTPEGTERSARIVVSAAATTGITTVVGINSGVDLSMKSTVHVAYGSTQTLHQIYVLSDPANQDTFLSQQPIAAIGTTTGVGTFGAGFENNQVLLKWYPDSNVSGMVSIKAYTEVLYKDLDPNGNVTGIGSFDYGRIFENVAQNTYLGINNRNIRSFELKYQGTPIYERAVNPTSPLELNRVNGTFSLKHFFSNTEELTYTPDSNLVGIAASALRYYPLSSPVSEPLPGTVYIVKQNNNQFNIATTINNARSGLGITFEEGVGAGNQHRFTMNKRDSKTIVAINGLVQKPLSFTAVSYDLEVPVNGIVTAFVLSGLSTVVSGDLISVDEEYSIVNTVGFGTTSIGPITGIGTWALVEVERGAVGSAATDHAAGALGRIYRGSFQIVNSNVHFTEAPLGGDLGQTDPSNLSYPRASFGGRTYLRQDYDTNQIFDDISDKFDGLQNTFGLTSAGAAVTGIGTTGGNGVLFVNSMFQAPFGFNNSGAYNFQIIEQTVGGIASVQFTGITSVGYSDLIIDEGDINENQLPRGGIIVSLASTPGRGYAPFAGARVRLEIGAGNSITGVVGVPTTGISYGIIDADYDNKTGILTVSTLKSHGLRLEDQMKLDRLKFVCPKNPVGTPNGFTYDPSTGISTISFASAHGLVNGDAVSIQENGITFSCAMGTGNKTYPRSTDPIFNQYLTISNVTANTLRVNVGAAGTNVYWNPSAADYNPNVGIMTVTIGTHDLYVGKGVVIPDNAFTFTCAQDSNATNHTYPRATDPASGTSLSVVAIGTVTSNITAAQYDSTAGILTATSAGHNLMVGNRVQIQGNSLTFTCTQDGNATNHTYPRSSDPINGKWVAVASTAANTFSIDVGASPVGQRYGHTFISAASGALVKQTGTIELNVGTGGTGTSAHTFVSAATSAIQSLPQSVHTFISATTDSIKTLNYQGITTSFFPDYEDSLPVTGIISARTFKTLVGPSTIPHTYESGGTVAQYYPLSFGSGYKTNIGTIGIAVTDYEYAHTFSSAGLGSITANTGSAYTATTASYASTTGNLILTIPNHGLTTSNTVAIATDSIGFKCSRDNYLGEHLYPRPTDPVAGIFTSINSVTTNTIAVNIGVGGGAGTGADISAVVGAGGTLIFTVNDGGSNYVNANALPPEPNGENLPIVGISRIGLGNTTITGVGASICVQVLGVGTATGIGSTLFEVKEFEFSKKGYGFKRGDKFTVAGLSTDPNAGDSFQEFELEVVSVFTDQIASWQFGNIDYIDSIKADQDGSRKRFPLYYERQLVSFETDINDLDSKEIDLSTVLLVFINGVVQEPGRNYQFTGGSILEFTTAPTTQDNVVIFFYRGTIGQDSFIFGVNENVKVGDSLKINKSTDVEFNRVPKDSRSGAQERERIVTRIDSAAVVETPFYQGVGISNDVFKPVTWNKQKRDFIIEGQLVTKARDSLEALINPFSHIIADFSTNDAEVYVDSTALFKGTTDALSASTLNLFAFAEVGFGTTAASGINHEQLVGVPNLVANIQGYIGLVTGISTCPGIGTDLALKIDFDISDLVNTGKNVTGFETNRPFKLYGTGINTLGAAVTSIFDHDSRIVAISTEYGDSIYYTSALTFKNGGRNGIITANIASYTDVSDFVGIGSTAIPYCHLTWGKFSGFTRGAQPVALAVSGFTYSDDLDAYPTVQRRGVGLRETGALPRRL